ncbi:hypothetical protein ANO11243_018090 [Dothideomycetidae sp. 11243]|nr:hypothetical protein ANO11243_018090 [fungal sp. No.11243]
MSSFSRLIRFESAENKSVLYADLGDSTAIPGHGSTVRAFSSFEDLVDGINATDMPLGKLLAPMVNPGAPIYCVGLNYRSHAEEAKPLQLKVTLNPPLWTKPAAALANPGEDIPVNKFCAQSAVDYEVSQGELVFVTSKESSNLSPDQAQQNILGYTVGNDLSCRKYRLPDFSAGQFFFAKAFDKFAPIGPMLISPHLFEIGDGVKLVTKVNGEVRQDAEIVNDLIFSPAEILSHMSQGTTIPAGTAVMTGTPAGVGAFCEPKKFLRSGDTIEIEIVGLGVLKNTMQFV